MVRVMWYVFNVMVMVKGSSMINVQKIIDNRVDLGLNPGIVAVLITPEGTFEAVAGETGSSDGSPLSTSTLFDIASVTKIVSGVLFADSIARGEVREDELLIEVLPELKLPPGGEKIKLVDLATHHSGLPAYPADHLPREISNPFADITAEVVQRSLAAMEELTFEPGTIYEYSNLGSGLLGQALVRRALTAEGKKIKNFEELLQKRFVATILDREMAAGEKKFMSTTGVEKIEELAQGHDREGPVPQWTMDYLAPAARIVSNIDTLKAFAKACLKGKELYPAISEAQRLRRVVGEPYPKIGLHWFVHESEIEGENFWHSGMKGGFMSWFGCSPTTGRASVVLTHSSAASVDDIGLHLVDPETSQLAPPARLHEETEKTGNEEALNELEGRYNLGGAWYTISRGFQGRLYASAPNRGSFELLPIRDSLVRWIVRQIYAIVVFRKGDNGKKEGFDLIYGHDLHHAERETEPADIQV